jgi:two-component system LytT family response regulator
MPELDGFGVLCEIAPDAMPVMVFVTAYDKYAIQAFEANALDYLLKPFSDERFEASLERARNHIHTRQAGELARRISGLLADTAAAETPPGGPARLQRLVVRSGGRVTFLKVEEIDWIEAAGVYVYLHAGGKAILYRATVGQLLARLDPQQFVRVHRSAAINTERIRELQPRSHGDYTVVLRDGTELALSRSYRASLETWLRQPL